MNSEKSPKTDTRPPTNDSSQNKDLLRPRIYYSPAKVEKSKNKVKISEQSSQLLNKKKLKSSDEHSLTTDRFPGETHQKFSKTEKKIRKSGLTGHSKNETKQQIASNWGTGELKRLKVAETSKTSARPDFGSEIKKHSKKRQKNKARNQKLKQRKLRRNPEQSKTSPYNQRAQKEKFFLNMGKERLLDSIYKGKPLSIQMNSSSNNNSDYNSQVNHSDSHDQNPKRERLLYRKSWLASDRRNQKNLEVKNLMKLKDISDKKVKAGIRVQNSMTLVSKKSKLVAKNLTKFGFSPVNSAKVKKNKNHSNQEYLQTDLLQKKRKIRSIPELGDFESDKCIYNNLKFGKKPKKSVKAKKLPKKLKRKTPVNSPKGANKRFTPRNFQNNHVKIKSPNFLFQIQKNSLLLNNLESKNEKVNSKSKSRSKILRNTSKNLLKKSNLSSLREKKKYSVESQINPEPKSGIFLKLPKRKKKKFRHSVHEESKKNKNLSSKEIKRVSLFANREDQNFFDSSSDNSNSQKIKIPKTKFHEDHKYLKSGKKKSKFLVSQSPCKIKNLSKHKIGRKVRMKRKSHQSKSRASSGLANPVVQSSKKILNSFTQQGSFTKKNRKIQQNKNKKLKTETFDLNFGDSQNSEKNSKKINLDQAFLNDSSKNENSVESDIFRGNFLENLSNRNGVKGIENDFNSWIDKTPSRGHSQKNNSNNQKNGKRRKKIFHEKNNQGQKNKLKLDEKKSQIKKTKSSFDAEKKNQRKTKNSRTRVAKKNTLPKYSEIFGENTPYPNLESPDILISVQKPERVKEKISNEKNFNTEKFMKEFETEKVKEKEKLSNEIAPFRPELIFPKSNFSSSDSSPEKTERDYLPFKIKKPIPSKEKRDLERDGLSESCWEQINHFKEPKQSSKNFLDPPQSKRYAQKLRFTPETKELRQLREIEKRLPSVNQFFNPRPNPETFRFPKNRVMSDFYGDSNQKNMPKLSRSRKESDFQILGFEVDSDEDLKKKEKTMLGNPESQNKFVNFFKNIFGNVMSPGADESQKKIYFKKPSKERFHEISENISEKSEKEINPPVPEKTNNNFSNFDSDFLTERHPYYDGESIQKILGQRVPEGFQTKPENNLFGQMIKQTNHFLSRAKDVKEKLKFNVIGSLLNKKNRVCKKKMFKKIKDKYREYIFQGIPMINKEMVIWRLKKMKVFTYQSQMAINIANQPIESDSGWGCMARSGQMLLYNLISKISDSLFWNAIGESETNKDNSCFDALFNLIFAFFDETNHLSPFSFGNLLKCSHEKLNKKLCEQWTSLTFFKVLQEIQNGFGNFWSSFTKNEEEKKKQEPIDWGNLRESLRREGSHGFEDLWGHEGSDPLQRIDELKKPIEKWLRGFEIYIVDNMSINSKKIRRYFASESPNNENFDLNEDNSGQSGKLLILPILLQLGHARCEKRFKNLLFRFCELSSFCGILGGRGNNAYFIFGSSHKKNGRQNWLKSFKNSFFLYFDPHTIKDVLFFR